LLYSIEELMARSGVRFGTSGARGLVEHMTDEVCYAYAMAFLRNVVPEARNVVLGHDLRPSSPAISAACARAIRDAGCEVIYAGSLPTPALACYASELQAPAIVVTGSHIPFDRNGIKFYRAEGEISKVDEQAIQSAVVEMPNELLPFSLGAPEAAAQENYVMRYVNFFGAGALSGITVAVYEHSSVARDVLRVILEKLGACVISLGRTDVFVPIDTEAVRPQDVEQARQWAQGYAFDALLSTDGDADRPLIGDERGDWLRGDVVGILCAHFLNADVIVTPVSSNTAVEKSGMFKKVVRTRIGSPYVIAAMESELSSGAGHVVGYEANGGFLTGSDINEGGRILRALPTRDAVLPMLAILTMAKQRECKVTDLIRSLPSRYTASDRIQAFPQEKSAALIETLRSDQNRVCELLAPNSGEVVQIDSTDGLRATFSNGDIVHLRPSGNAPELRCYAESDSTKKAQQLCLSCLDRIAK
jgi:phosphomannomutase